MERRKLEELNLIDDFLFQEVVTRGEEGERFCRTLLETILEKEIGKVKVVAQKTILGRSTRHHGIKIDAYIEAREPPGGQDGKIEGVEMRTDIYDIEPNKYRTDNEAKRTRYYHALIDSKVLRSGTDYSRLQNVVLIMILPYDPFGKNRMVYTIENHCVEDETVKYHDGIKTIYLYTKGTEGNPSQKLKEMLKYIEETTVENATGIALQNIHKTVERVKRDEEVGISYMKAFEMERMYIEEGKREGRAEGKAEGKAEGRAEGKAESVLKFLGEIGKIPEDLQRRIMGERDTDKLEKWLKLSVQSDSVEQFLERM